jgi:antitoxin (DNA-binding transcriptional repressor) of toxin-antitoxin stability system
MGSGHYPVFNVALGGSRPYEWGKLACRIVHVNRHRTIAEPLCGLGFMSGWMGGVSRYRFRREALCPVPCDAKMYPMRKATLRDLRYRFSVVEDLLDGGEEIQITRRKRVIARLLPAEPAASPRRPDFFARLKQLYRGKALKVTGAELIASERDRS